MGGGGGGGREDRKGTYVGIQRWGFGEKSEKRGEWNWGP